MLVLVKECFTNCAEKGDVLDRARGHAQDVRRILVSSRNLVDLFHAGAPVSAREVSNLLDQAEGIGLVSRAGMKVSGLSFVVNESAMTIKAMGITAAEGMTTARHVFLQASRAQNILNRNPGSYQPRDGMGLYGPTVPGWTPLIP